MYSDMIGDSVTILVATKGDTVQEYRGILKNEDEKNIMLENVSVGMMLMNLQRGIFGGSASQYKTNVEKVIINKNYIISCMK